MRCQTQLAAMLGLSALLLVGCQTRPGYSLRDVQPMYDDYGHARSLVLSTPAVRSTQQTRHQHEPWYAGRRDVGPFVTAGTISPRYERSVTYSTDRQYISNGRVYDHYQETTHRQTYRDSTR